MATTVLDDVNLNKRPNGLLEYDTFAEYVGAGNGEGTSGASSGWLRLQPAWVEVPGRGRWHPPERRATGEPEPVALDAGVLGSLLAVASFIVLVCVEVPSTDKHDFSKVNRCLAVLLPMVFLWLFSVFSPNLTALLPIPLYALLELGSSSDFAKTYLTDTGILFVGVFIVCTAMEACNVHRRFALFIIDRVGRTPATIMMGFMIPPWFLSLFSSNTTNCCHERKCFDLVFVLE